MPWPMLNTTTPGSSGQKFDPCGSVAATQAMVLGTIYGATGAFMEGNTLLIRGDFSFGGVYNVDGGMTA